MDSLLRDLYGHQVWADAEHWRAIGDHAVARDDRAIRDRLHHIALVQRLFLWAVGDRQDAFAFTKSEEFPSFDALRTYAREHHDRLAPALAAMTDARLAESIAIPWIPDPPFSLTVAEALTQAAMHTHYHRGQNATRLRELGGEPPMTDFIYWLWKGRPEPIWNP
jgi:uncharacterized damage-inducible protein DinB